MFWNGAAFFAGAFSGAAANMLFITLNGAMFPPPEGFVFDDPAAVDAYVASLPATAMVIVLIAHLAQAFVGALVGARLAIHRMAVAMALGVFSMLGGLYNLMTIDHPTWMWIEVPLYLVVAWAGARIVLVYGNVDGEA